MPRMLSFDDPRWRSLAAGYRVPYDPRSALQALSSDFTDEAAWKELWSELHHQGNVGEASYAAVPTLVVLAEAAPKRDWNLFALTATIEVERHRRDNPDLPHWLAPLYRDAWAALSRLALSEAAGATDPFVVRTTVCVVALARGALRLGAYLNTIDESDIDEALSDQLRWAELYDDTRSLPPA